MNRDVTILFAVATGLSMGIFLTLIGCLESHSAFPALSVLITCTAALPFVLATPHADPGLVDLGHGWTGFCLMAAVGILVMCRKLNVLDTDATLLAAGASIIVFASIRSVTHSFSNKIGGYVV